MVAAARSQSFQGRRRDLPELRPMPVVATRLIQACQDPKVDSKQVARIIECDPGVSLALMKVANSAMYGVSGKVRTIDQAIVMLGFRAVRDLSLSIAGAQLFKQGDKAVAERTTLWRHSLACATVARTLARKTRKAPPEEAFLSGVFHDVGKLLFYELEAEEYCRLQSDRNGAATIDDERREFGATHTEIGLDCGDRWGLPEPVRMAIGFHHSPTESPVHRTLVALTDFANQLAKAWKLADESDTFDAPVPDAGAPFGLDEAAIEETRVQATNDFAEVRAICGG